MSLVDNSFKKKLLTINDMIVKRESRKKSMMYECVENKLNNNLEIYEQDLMDTCRYVMMRNPVIMVKDFTLMSKTEEKDYE